MGGEIFNNKKLASILGSKRKKKTDSSASGFLSDKYIINREALKRISDLVEEACNKKVKNPYFMQSQLRLIERILLTELEEYTNNDIDILATAEMLRRQAANEMQRIGGGIWTTNTTPIGSPPNTRPQPLPRGYLGTMTGDISLIPDGGSSSDPFPYSDSSSVWGGLLPKDNDE